ncbi:glycyl-radical enzyme activating protein [Lacticaseibacillus sp. GG6-2]
MESINYDRQACVFNIQRYSIHDGPGIRTIVFIKGCPLRCQWCFNPESQSPLPTPEFGEMKTVREVYAEIKKDAVTYRRSGGGVTFSGGEALTQPDFVEELIKCCRLNGWTTAIETEAFVPEATITRLIPQIDHVLLDIKAIPDDIHQLGTGVSNRRILKNALLIDKLAKDVVVRVPVIPTFNYSAEQIDYICQFVAHMPHVHTLHLLPYMTVGVNKYAQLGRDYPLTGVAPLTMDDLLPLKQVVEAHGLNCVLGG